VRAFEGTLNSIFRNFDFTLNSYHPKCPQFDELRARMTEMHAIMNVTLKGDLNPGVVVVLSRFVSLASALFGYINQTATGESR
jgi:hypothetical protein